MVFNALQQLRTNIEAIRIALAFRPGDQLDEKQADTLRAYAGFGGLVCSPFRQLKDAIPHCLTPGGLVIKFGYHSIIMGRKRGSCREHLVCSATAARSMIPSPARSGSHRPKLAPFFPHQSF
ncbi:hypothetical protein [Mucilaginibacter sp. 3215]|uniref:hypothetical protein n=1 Tax=Mucilaginibacter sp. 3215 TaxID=3373912 RepID=UPI003D1D589F